MTAQETEQFHFLDELEPVKTNQVKNENKNQTISKEQIETKQKELVSFILQLKNYIEEIPITNITKQDKQVLLFNVQKILERAKLTQEVVRLADVVYKITKSEETDIKFKGFLKSSLYKIYRTD